MGTRVSAIHSICLFSKLHSSMHQSVTRGWARLVKCDPNMHESLGLMPSTALAKVQDAFL